MCWFPRKPGALRIRDEDFEHVIRCGDCPGCIELERRRLADRLVARYPDHNAELWLVRIHCSQREASGLCHNLHRRRSLTLEPGLFRLGVSSFAVLARAKGPIAAALRTLGLPHRIERIRFSRGRRAWRAITAGLLVSRERYGEQVKRWYCRGLPPAERKRWEVVSKPYQKGYSKSRSPRAWKRGSLVLVPPEVWQLGRHDRRTVRELLRKAPDPESAKVVIDLVAAVTTKLAGHFQSIAAPKGRLSREQVQSWYKAMAEKKAASAHSGSGSEILPPLSEVGGYVSSVHSTSADAPKLTTDEELQAIGKSGDPVWMERERVRQRQRGAEEARSKARTKTWIEQWAERMQSLVKGGRND